MLPVYVARSLGGSFRYLSRRSEIFISSSAIRKRLLLSNFRSNAVHNLPVLGACCYSCTSTDKVDFKKTKMCINYLNGNLSRRYISSDKSTKDNVQLKRRSSATLRLETTEKASNLDAKTSELRAQLKGWKTVYRFKHIRLARVLQKIKLYQTAFTCCLALPGSLGFYLYGAIPVETVSFMVGTSMLASVMLYIIGGFCSRLIGVIYVSEEDDSLVRIAHLNFWGQREDRVIMKNDFVPFSELPDNVSELYINLRFYSDSDYLLHICVRHGTVFDKHQFEEIFGTHTGLDITDSRKNK